MIIKGDIKSSKTVIIKPKENNNTNNDSNFRPILSNTASNLSNINKILLPPIK